MPKALVIDTTTEACSVALSNEGQLFEEYQIAPRLHGDLVLSMVDKVLTRAQVKLEDLDVIGYGQGPGAFTGLRICLSVVQGLAFGANLPTVGVSSLQAMAQMAYHKNSSKRVLSAIDARMGEIYWGEYSESNGIMELLDEETVSVPKNVTLKLPVSSKYYAVGTGWQTYSSILLEHLVTDIRVESEVSYPSAEYMLPVVLDKLQKGETVTAEMAQPVYLRNNVAKKKAEQGIKH